MCEENKSQNREKMINFIETYRNLPILWDRTCKDYVNRDEKSKAYNKLLLVYRKNVKEATIQDVKKKINSLRSNYRKEVRKVEHFKNYGQMYEPTCWTFQKLSFLKASKCEPSYAPRIKQESREPEQFDEDSRKSSIPSIPTENFKRSTQNAATASEHFQNDEYLVEESNEMQESLAKIWVCKLKEMKPDQKLFAEKFINDILFEGEMGTLHRNSVTINQPSFPSQYVVSSSTNSSTRSTYDESPIQYYIKSEITNLD